MKKQIILLAAVALLFTTCTKEVYNSEICFQETILPIFVSNCSQSECHDSHERAAGYDLSNYEGIMRGVKAKHPLLSEVYKTIRGNSPSMPRKPYASLSARQITDIKVWIEMGAPNTSHCQSCDTNLITYTARIRPIIDNWCIGCHTATNAGGGYDLTTYAGLVSSVTNARLMGTLRNQSGYSAMPKNTSALTDCDINAIQKWINTGYLQN